MDDTRPRRLLLEDWHAPTQLGVDECADLPDPQFVGLHVYGHPSNAVNKGGITYQKCGGGFRVLRKRIGNS